MERERTEMFTFLKNWKIWLTALGAAIAFNAVTPDLAEAQNRPRPRFDRGHDSDSDSGSDSDSDRRSDSDSGSDDSDHRDSDSGSDDSDRRGGDSDSGSRGGGGGGSASDVPELDGKMAPAGMAVVAIGAMLISARRRED